MNNITELNILNKYIKNIPWEQFLIRPSDNSNEYKNAFSSLVKKVPYGENIDFLSDEWDFRHFFVDVNDTTYKLRFSKIPNDYKKYFKLMCIYKMTWKTKISTLSVQLVQINTLLSELQRYKPSKYMSFYTTDDYIYVIENKQCSASLKHSIYSSLYLFFEFLEVNCEIKTNIDIRMLKEKSSYYKKLAKNANKIPNIPDKYFYMIVKKMLTVMRNIGAPINDRVTAAASIILSQTGLRISDLLTLKINDIQEYSTQTKNIKIFLLNYSSKKPSKPNRPLMRFTCILSDIAKEAFDVLLEIKRKHNSEQSKNFLVTFKKYGKKFGTKEEIYPISKARFIPHYRNFFGKYLQNEARKEWEGIKPVKVPLYKSNLEMRKIKLYIPETRQYRVHVCTSLYYKGADLAWIRKWMGHLTEYMTAYYVRPRNNYQENYKYSEKVIIDIVERDVKPIGRNSDNLITSLKQFIKENKLNVVKDPDSVIKALGDKLIIKARLGGACIKTTMVPCGKDVRTNKIECAYNLCPNLYHFFYMLDINYFNFKFLIKTYYKNKENGFTVSASNEKNRIRGLCLTRIIPELDELDKTISKSSIEDVINEYPELAQIIKNRKEIRKEVLEWTKN